MPIVTTPNSSVMLTPKVASNIPWYAAYTSAIIGTPANSAVLCRITWPMSGVINALAFWCVATGAGNCDIGVYDTTATTRNLLAHTGSTALVATSYVSGVISLTVNAGDSADLAISADNTTASSIVFAQSNKLAAKLPSGWAPVTLGGSPFLCARVAGGMFPLPSTVAEASFAAGDPVPILARYA